MENNNVKDSSLRDFKKELGFSVAGLLCLLVYSYIEFLGLMYMTEGDSVISIVIPGVIALFLVVLSFALPYIKSSNSAFLSKRRSKLTIVALVSFFIFGLASWLGVMQFFKIKSYEQEIHDLYIESVENAHLIYPKYEEYAERRITNYQQLLEKVIAQKVADKDQYDELVGRFAGENDQVRFKLLVKSLRRSLLPSDDTFQNTFNVWLGTVGVANLWNVSFVHNVQVLDSRIRDYIMELNNLSARFFHPGEAHIAFEYPAYKSNEQIQNYFKFDGIVYTHYAFGAWLLTMFALLMPWLRDIRSKKDL